jgi:hypothetical protein
MTMAIPWRWLYPRRVLFATIPDRMMPEDIVQYMGDFIQELETIPNPRVHVIYDVSQVQKLPGTVRDYLNATFDVTSLPGHGWAILIGANAAVNLILTVYMNLNSNNIRACSSLEEAMEFLHQIDPIQSEG